MLRRRFLTGIGATAGALSLKGCVTVPQMNDAMGMLNGLGIMGDPNSRVFDGAAQQRAREAQALMNSEPWHRSMNAQQWLAQARSFASHAGQDLKAASLPLNEAAATPEVIMAMAESQKPLFRSIEGYQSRMIDDYYTRNPSRLAQHIQPVFNADGSVLIQPGTRITFTQKSYCLDKRLPAPRRGDKFRVMPIGSLYAEPLQPLVANLSRYAAENPNDFGRMQHILWALRDMDSCNDGFFQTLQPHHYELINRAMPNGVDVLRQAHQQICANPISMITRSLTQQLAPELNSIQSQLNNALRLDLGTQVFDLSRLMNADPRSADSMISAILDELGSMPVNQPIPEDNSDFSFLAPNVPIRAVGTDTLTARYEIENHTNTPFLFVPTNYAVFTTRETQRMPILPPSANTTTTASRNLGFIGGNQRISDEQWKIYGIDIDALTRELGYDLVRSIGDIATFHYIPRWINQNPDRIDALRNGLRGATRRLARTLPIVGNVISGYEVITGRDILLGHELNTFERVLAGVAVVPGLNAVVSSIGLASDGITKVAPRVGASLGNAARRLGDNATAIRLDEAFAGTIYSREIVRAIGGNDELEALADRTLAARQDTAYQRIFRQTESDLARLVAISP